MLSLYSLFLKGQLNFNISGLLRKSVSENYYLPKNMNKLLPLKQKMAKKNWTRNEAIEMMHKNTANALKSIAVCVKKWEYNSQQIIDYLIEIADVLDAQALTVTLRDQLGYEQPIDDF